MHWSEPVYILSVKKHGERDVLVTVLGKECGKYAGLVRGGQSSKQRSIWQEGHLVDATWRARLSEHLGSVIGETIRDYSSGLLHSPLGLAALLCTTALVDAGLPERQPMPALFDALAHVLPLDEGVDDLARYAQFEMTVLAALGYGLDLDVCALTGTRDDLAYVSPKTGRAVNRDAAQLWAAKLFRLPHFLKRPEIPSWQEVWEALVLSGHFLEQRLYSHLPPYALTQLIARRERLLALVDRERREKRLVGSRVRTQLI